METEIHMAGWWSRPAQEKKNNSTRGLKVTSGCTHTHIYIRIFVSIYSVQPLVQLAAFPSLKTELARGGLFNFLFLFFFCFVEKLNVTNDEFGSQRLFNSSWVVVGTRPKKTKLFYRNKVQNLQRWSIKQSTDKLKKISRLLISNYGGLEEKHVSLCFIIICAVKLLLYTYSSIFNVVTC